MKIYLMTDMEGTAGILDYDDWCQRDGRFYAKGIRLVTREINSAIEGFFAGGATEVLVCDGHGEGGVDVELLDERALLKRGADQPLGAWGLDSSFAGLAFVGQHAKAGTPGSHLTHTGWFSTIDRSINGISIGEYGAMALSAMELGVPTFFASGEQALCDEAEALTPGVETVPVKWGTLPDGLDDLDEEAYRYAKLSAVHLAPTRARQVIRAGAKAAAERLRAAPDSFSYPELTPPYVRRGRFRSSDGEPPWQAMDEHPSSIIELLGMPFTRVAAE